MKKLMVASAIAMIMAAGSTMAAVQQGSQGEVQFSGSVAAKTCDIIVTGDGAVNNAVQFGVVNVSETKAKDFKISLKEPGCITGAKKATFAWYSPALGETGIKNQSGTAEGSYVELKAKNGATNNPSRTDVITALNNGVDFTVTQAEMGFEYTATLHADSTPGSFETAASYTVVYE
ncbi:TPA: hypothetical protein JS353_004588 [Escherichia coli]|nr:hypothetical protein [Escherichia coli]MCV2139673.1 hypothetical protein [Escherichia coli]HAY0556178.1 hypothetical protein [Escherichia coli]HAY4248417.1 hypothetical protein [Escherichia coli]HBA5347043.1 hypothetical protein [Escherichia coli]